MSLAQLAALKATLLAFALELPGAYEDHPWEDTVAKVDKKIFAFLGSDDPRYGHLLTVKLPASGSGVLMLGCAEPAGYNLGKSGWVSLRHDRGELPPAELLCDWIEESYRAVALKRRVKELEAGRDR